MDKLSVKSSGMVKIDNELLFLARGQHHESIINDCKYDFNGNLKQVLYYLNLPEHGLYVTMNEYGIYWHTNPNKWVAEDTKQDIIDHISYKDYQRHIEFVFDTLLEYGITTENMESFKIRRIDNCFDSILPTPYSDYEPILKAITPANHKDMRNSKDTEVNSTIYNGNNQHKICTYNKTEHAKKKLKIILPNHVKRDEYRKLTEQKVDANLTNINEKYFNNLRLHSHQIIKNTLYSATPQLVKNETVKMINEMRKEEHFKMTPANMLTQLGLIQLNEMMHDVGKKDIREIFIPQTKREINTFSIIQKKMNETVALTSNDMIDKYELMKSLFNKAI